MSAKFVREKHLAKLLMERLGVPGVQYLDPNALAGRETGADVLAVVAEYRIGIQVTEIDTGDTPGQSRSGEKKSAREGEARSGGVYGGWAQNDPTKILGAIGRAISRKVTIAERHAFSDFTEVWLLVSCGVPELGAVISTFIMTPWLNAEALNCATADQLAQSKYGRVFVHPVLGTEKALYQWTEQSRWQKDVQPEDPRTRGPFVWDILAAARR